MTREYRLHGRLKACGIPKPLQRHLDELDAYPEQSAGIAAARALVAGRGPTLTLTGQVGRGKTAIAAAAATTLILDDRCGIRWTSGPGLVARLDRAFGSPERDEALALLDADGGLVIDDLDKVRATEHVAQALFAAIDARIVNGSPLLVTTNLMPSDIGRKFPQPHGAAIASRLSGGVVVEVGGPDRRLA